MFVNNVYLVFWIYAPVGVNFQGSGPLMHNPEDSDTFVISHPGDYDHGNQTSGSSDIKNKEIPIPWDRKI